MSVNLSLRLQELEAIASALGIEVIQEAIHSFHPRKGGLCCVRGKYMLIIDRKITLSEKVIIFTESICLFELDDVYVSPRTREILEAKKVVLASKGKTLPICNVNAQPDGEK
jgi:hypothetical protein